MSFDIAKVQQTYSHVKPKKSRYESIQADFA